MEQALALSSGSSFELAERLVQMAPQPRSDDVMVMVLTASGEPRDAA